MDPSALTKYISIELTMGYITNTLAKTCCANVKFCSRTIAFNDKDHKNAGRENRNPSKRTKL